MFDHHAINPKEITSEMKSKIRKNTHLYLESPQVTFDDHQHPDLHLKTVIDRNDVEVLHVRSHRSRRTPARAKPEIQMLSVKKRLFS
jgi:hypothetical protein